MQFCTYYIQDFLCELLGMNNDDIKFSEPFKGLFTQGMVCHETYRDEEDNWLSPEEVIHGWKNFFQKDNPSKNKSRAI